MKHNENLLYNVKKDRIVLGLFKSVKSIRPMDME